MKLIIPLRILHIFGGLLIVVLLYGACYDTLPAWRDLHNRTMFRLQHDAVPTQASVVHVGGERHRQKYGYSTTPIFGIQYTHNGQTFIGFVKAHNSGSASDHSIIAKATEGKSFEILIDSHDPAAFYAQPNTTSILQILPNFFWYMILWASVLTGGHAFLKWVQSARSAQQTTFLLNIQDKDFRQFSLWMSFLGFGFWAWVLVNNVVLPPWLPSNSAHIAQALSADEGLLGSQWQRWSHIEYRFKGYNGGGNRCPNVGYVDAIHMQWEIRWKHEDAPQALAQIQNITDTTYCNSMLAANQTIALNQTDNSFAGIINGRNAIETHADGYDYTNVELTIVYPRKSVVKNNAISIQLDAAHTARFPLYLYVW